MKKLYFCFILLFGLFTFAPQIVKANAPKPPTPEEIKIRQEWEKKESEMRTERINKLKEKYFDCLMDHKLNLPKKYKGSNLKLLEGPRKEFFSTGNQYFIDTINSDGIAEIKFSLAFDCTAEFIPVMYTRKMSIGTALNVIDVPLGSYLKYIPSTQEFKVIPPTDKEYKNFLTSYKRSIHYNMPNSALYGILIALLLTLVIEGLMALPFGWKFVGLVSLTNLITNPALNFTLWHYQITSTQTILLLECLVVLVEWGIFSICMRKKYFKLFLFALLANAISYLSGYFINF